MDKPISQADRVIKILMKAQDKPMEAKELARLLYDTYPDVYKLKEIELKKVGTTNILSQITAEIGSLKNSIKKKNPNVFWQDSLKKPRVYWYGRADLFDIEIKAPALNEGSTIAEDADEVEEDGWDGREESLYPIFNNYLHECHDIYPLRIDEKKSKNSRGAGGNSWLHPDIVALDPVSKKWEGSVKDCANMSHGEIVNLWSFEVKKALTTGNVRKHYFQAVSNSSWANYGYLVATSIETNEAMSELKMLHALHGIGVIIINTNDIKLTEVRLPAKKREQVDWDSVNRLSFENKDFMEFINNITDYLKTNRLRKRDWHDLQ